MESTEKKAIEIITGRYGKGTVDDNRIVDSIFGENAKEWFEIYFHWYNVIHELGHGIMIFNCKTRPHPVAEEQLVNDFAVAFWQHYGEEEKILKLKSILTYALSHLRCPVKSDISHVEYALDNWGTEELNNFNNYGWFQFSCVSISLCERKTIEQVLNLMGVKNITAKPRKTLIYPVINEETVIEIISNAADILREWGARLPDVSCRLDNDPNKHMCNIIDFNTV